MPNWWNWITRFDYCWMLVCEAFILKQHQMNGFLLKLAWGTYLLKPAGKTDTKSKIHESVSNPNVVNTQWGHISAHARLEFGALFLTVCSWMSSLVNKTSGRVFLLNFAILRMVSSASSIFPLETNQLMDSFINLQECGEEENLSEWILSSLVNFEYRNDCQ